MRHSIKRIVSGGQTGVDRAALDVALELGVPCGGWCPKGRLAEDGPIDAKYPLNETPSDDYAQRTRWNVRDSDATLIITRGEPVRGTALTAQLARRAHKPLLIVDPAQANAAQLIGAWLSEHHIAVLNVAGPRASQSPHGYHLAAALLRRVLGDGPE